MVYRSCLGLVQSYGVTLIFPWKTEQYSLVLPKTTLQINANPVSTVQVSYQNKYDTSNTVPAFSAIINLMDSPQRSC